MTGYIFSHSEIESAYPDWDGNGYGFAVSQYSALGSPYYKVTAGYAEDDADEEALPPETLREFYTGGYFTANNVI